jgi:hypothetical protein
MIQSRRSPIGIFLAGLRLVLVNSPAGPCVNPKLDSETLIAAAR